MYPESTTTALQKTTSYKVVLPFYLFAALSFLTACVLLLANTDAVHQHYFHPRTLAISHLMALGWGTMIILGASYQLLPVLIEGRLSSEGLAYGSFLFAAAGIPLLVTGFYVFHTGALLQAGAVLVNAGILCYLVNVLSSIYESGKHDIHAWFMAAASVWLFATTFFGLLLVFNFTHAWLPADSISYLSLHAHMGLAGWFLLLVLGVASRLIPMFLISKYSNARIMRWIFGLVNGGLIGFILLRGLGGDPRLYYTPFLLVLAAILLFAIFCYKAYKSRIRKSLDPQMKLSGMFVAQLFLPLACLMVVIWLVSEDAGADMVLLYGFCIFFGWLTAIILAMTFKTLPFIVWNKVYQDQASGQTPAPKELFSGTLFRLMTIAYLAGFFVFVSGMVSRSDILLKTGAAALLLAAMLYVCNVGKTLLHQPDR
jgi:hypothetical protein